MKESLATFRKAVNESADLQEKLKGGTDLVELGKENGHDFSAEDLTAAYEELQDSEEGLTEFELEAVSGGWAAPPDFAAERERQIKKYGRFCGNRGRTRR